MTLKQTRKYLISKGWESEPGIPQLLNFKNTFTLNLPEDPSGLNDGEPESLRCGLATQYASMVELRPKEDIAAEIESLTSE